MTNADKFLKDGVSVEEFARDIFKNAHISHLEYIPVIDENSLKRYLRKQTRPTLTEDERVILRNIKNDYDTIERTSFGSLKIVKSKNGYTDFYEFNHLFQFIKNGEEYEIRELLND